jgi:hypothetical protein
MSDLRPPFLMLMLVCRRPNPLGFVLRVHTDKSDLEAIRRLARLAV